MVSLPHRLHSVNQYSSPWRGHARSTSWIVSLIGSVGIAVFALIGLTVGAHGDDAAAIRILERRCIQCHDAAEAKGKLSLELRDEALKGGDSGPSIVPGKPDESPLWQQISGDTPDMPKGLPSLSKAEQETIRQWIIDGASWPAEPLKDRRHEVTDWWSFQPLVRPSVPSVAIHSVKGLPSAEKAPTVQPVDAFLEQARRQVGLPPSPEADRATLIRRLSFDLIGLPPTAEEVNAFVADREPLAYERLVDRLLDNPAYGERWARHWLDVVHFGETHGYDKDKLRLHAWPYRDYVIRAFNEDRPYGRFIEEQLAGDVLYPGTADGIEGLGFIAAGPWDFIGHAEVPETKIDGQIARHLDRDDMVTNTIQSFCSLTIQCAQCHNHKFDPISQEDYYSLQAVFAAIDRTEKSYDRDPQVAAQRATLKRELAAADSGIANLEQAIRDRAGEPLKTLDQQISDLEKQAKSKSGQYPAEFGYHSQIANQPDVEKWVQVELPAVTELKEVVLRPCHDDFNGIGDGFGFPESIRVQIADDAGFTSNVRTLATKALDNPKLNAVRISAENQAAKFIRVTATKLAPRMNDFIFAIAEFEAITPTGVNAARGAMVTSLDSIEAGPRWGRANLVDGLYPGTMSDVSAQLALAKEQRQALWDASITAEQSTELTSLQQKRQEAQTQLSALPAQSVAYVGAVHTGGGAFTGTGAQGGKPRTIRRLARGSVTQPLEEVAPGALSAVASLTSRFDLSKEGPEGERRAALARWVASPDNPLTWRSAVNRVWQYHFGRGLVETPNDFGRNGGLPSHPELLDWLACELREHQSIKQLHRQIVLSAAYRQISTIDPAKAEIDSDNKFLWRMNRRRLEAEPLRDSVLATAGLLNKTMYGPSFQDFKIEKPEHSPHYEYHLHDPNDPQCFRRSVYRFLVRSQPEPFMASLDCADPSMQVERRNESASPLQALSLWNDAFMLTAARLAEERAASDKTPLEQQVAIAWFACVSRPIQADDLATLTELARTQGMGSVWRVLWNSNQFVFVE
ncbi:MAG: PSD1 and planctomycete cytochrome C domain-containing protein [Planctomycetaceae bacterium]